MQKAVAKAFPQEESNFSLLIRTINFSWLDPTQLDEGEDRAAPTVGNYNSAQLVTEFISV